MTEAESSSISSITPAPVLLECCSEFPSLVPPRGVVRVKTIMLSSTRTFQIKDTRELNIFCFQ
jgi:hypothetical protein